MTLNRRNLLKTIAAAGASMPLAARSGNSEQAKPDQKKHQVLIIIIGDASETLDTMYPYYRLIEGGYQPLVAAPEKRLYQMVMHEVRPGWTITKEWEGYQIQADIAFGEIDVNQYLGIFFSGGRAPEYIRADPELIRITQHFFDENEARDAH